MRRPSLLIGTAVAAVTTSLLSAGADAGTSTATYLDLRGTVAAVVDGDTIDVRIAGRARERVRLIGVDTPERGSCYATQATSETKRLTLRKVVRVVGDRTQPRRDRFGRLLAYVTMPDGRDLGRRLLEGGFARLLVVGRPFQRVSSYRASQRRAQAAGSGLWAACGSSPPPPPVTADLAVTATSSHATASIGQDVTYTLTVSNAGPAPSQQVGVLTDLPGVTLVSITASQGTCATAPVVGCTLGALAAGSSATATIVVRPTQQGTVTNSVAVNSSTTDPVSGNNSATITLSVAGPPPPPPPPPAANCHASYPDFCIPPPPPDLDCANFTQRRFRVRWDVPDPDPHRLDGDRDGLACES